MSEGRNPSTPDHLPLGTVLAGLAAVEARLDPGAAALSVRVLRHLTVEGLEPYLRWHAAADGLKVDLAFGGYGTLAQDLLEGDSQDLLVLALDLGDLDPAYGGPGWTAGRALEEILDLLSLAAERTRATVVVHRFLLPLHPPEGILLPKDGSDLASQIQALNAGLAVFVREHAPRFQLLDWDLYLRRLGAAEALDPRFGYQARAPFRPAFMDLWARDLCRILRALTGKSRKCVVLDCDNTLWGGVVGEDGPNGIALDARVYPGRAYHDFQRALLGLQARGILLALCSRNNEADVFEVLDGHPDCLIRRRHLAAWRISWEDKAASIAALAEELNLGLDAMVFVDDNPVECARVRQALPGVRVLPVPENLWELPDLLHREGRFDSLSRGEEDRARTELYRGEAQRKSVRRGFPDLDSYLASLELRARIQPLGPGELERAAQLTQKTNQFNLTTRRYSAADLARLADGGASAVFGMSVEDRFGGLGMVGVLAAECEGRTGRVLNLLLSCRALGRRAEQAFVAKALRDLGARWGLARWEAEHLPTAKNAQTRDFWERAGFTLVEGSEGRRTYALEHLEALAELPSCYTLLED